MGAAGDGDSAPGLELALGSLRRRIGPGETLSVGRDPGAGLRTDDPFVSRVHLMVGPGAEGWVLTDCSRNGVYVGSRRVTRIVVRGPVIVALGRSDGIELTVTPVHDRAAFDGNGRSRHGPAQVGAGSGRAPSAVHQLGERTLRIGRLPENDVVVDDLLVSRRHAELRPGPDGYHLVDLGSANGTYVNGRRVGASRLDERDIVGIGPALLELVDGTLVEYRDNGDVNFAVHGLVVRTRDGTCLLDDVGFAVKGSSMLAVVGPSGAGKSTLLRALTGQRPGDRGSVRYDGRDLYNNIEELRHRIGLVPQDDILHPQLRVRQALDYAAALRFPADTSVRERDNRVGDVLAELGLTAHGEQSISSLSGGQRKRTSVAVELLTRPSLLFLDEPTSGLDPGLDKSVMTTLRGLADGGRTVVVVTHSVAHLDQCHRVLILAPGGRVAYFGPPRDAPAYFGVAGFAEIFQELGADTDGVWSRRFRDSVDYYRNVEVTFALPAARKAPPRPAPPPRQQSFTRQFAVLTRRYLSVIAADRAYLVSLAVLPVVLSLLARAVPGSDGLSVAAGTTQPRQLLLVLMMGAALMGSAAAIRELVKERLIYRRERAAGLSRMAYLCSKWTVLGVVTAAQAVALTGLSLLGQPGPDEALVLSPPVLEVGVAVLMVALAAVAVGLLVSALIPNADRGMPILVLLIMAQLILCGGLFPVRGRAVLEQLSWLAFARPGFAMGAATIDMNRVPPPGDDPLWRHTPSAWTADFTILVCLILLVAGATAVLLARLDRQSRRPRPR